MRFFLLFVAASLAVTQANSPDHALQRAIDDCFQRKFSYASRLKVDEVGYFFSNFKRLMVQSIRRMKKHFLQLTDAELENLCDMHMPESHPVSYESLVAKVNTAKTTWVAETSTRFKESSVRDAKRLMGTILGKNAIRLKPKHKVLKNFKSSISDSSLPESFDAREKWPQCPTIGRPRDQADCGSCWAFASTEALNDRLCIASNGTYTGQLSVQHTASCCDQNACSSFGCDGGQPGAAWDWFTSNGVVTGGDYEDIGKSDTCWPYQLPMCSHHVHSQYPPCEGDAATPQCRSTCSETKYPVGFKQDIHKADSAFALDSREDIKKDLMENGPVTAAFEVFADFPSYKGGVYQHVTGDSLGGHAVKIIGWGVEKGEHYWLVVNSWNDTWGEKGLFRIKMGDCGIDDSVVAGIFGASNPVRAQAEDVYV